MAHELRLHEFFGFGGKTAGRFGSLVDLLTNITPTAASEGKPAVREADFQNSNLNDCFTQQRPFRAEENHENEGPLTARSGPS